MERNNDSQLQEASIHLNKKLVVPRAYVTHSKVKYMVYHTIEMFSHEEKQAIGFFYNLDEMSIKDIAEKTELTENRVLSAICLYEERLQAKLNLFKKTLPYDASDVLEVGDILLHDIFNETQ